MHNGKEKLIQLAYILGVALLLAGLIYFFAANWEVLPKAGKVACSVGVMVLLYVLSYSFSKLFRQHQFLSRLLLFAGCFAFGISVALVGQIYNSHANSYVLFSVWFIASLLFSISTRYQPLYVLSYILLHLTIWFYFYPDNELWAFNDGYVLLVLSLLTVVNIISFFIIEKKWIYAPYIKPLSYIAAHILMIWISMKFLFELYFLVTNAVYVLMIAGCFYYFLKIKQQNAYLTMTGIATFVYFIIKYIEVVVEHFGPFIFILTIILGMVAVYINIYIVKKIMSNARNKKQELMNAGETELGDSVDKKVVVWKNLATVLFTILSSIVITVSLLLLLSETIGDFESLAVVFFFMGILLFLLPGIYVNAKNEVIGGTWICIGYLMSSIAVLQIAAIYFFAWICMIFIGLIAIRNNGIRIVLYGLAHVVLSFKLYMDVTSQFDIVCLMIIAINIVAILVAKYKSQYFPEHTIAESFYKNSFFYAMLFFFIVTFIDGIGYKYGLYIAYNILFFVLVTALVFWAKNREQSFEFRLAISFWFAFLFYKYYDIVWQLLHKSVGLIILGLVFVLVAYWFERRYIQSVHNIGNLRSYDKSTTDIEMWGNKKKTILLIGLILLQLLFLGVQIGSSEYALANGQQVKLELQPIDPRSLMQGDYVVLNYRISQLGNERPFWLEPERVEPDANQQVQEKEKYDIEEQELSDPTQDEVREEWEQQWQEQWDNRWDKDLRYGQRLRLVLTPDEHGVHQFKEIYNGQTISDRDVIINGTYRGWQIAFGIESYFVPEGTGLEVERTANYAYVRISANGNAILERLSEQ